MISAHLWACTSKISQSLLFVTLLGIVSIVFLRFHVGDAYLNVVQGKFAKCSIVIINQAYKLLHLLKLISSLIPYNHIFMEKFLLYIYMKFLLYFIVSIFSTSSAINSLCDDMDMASPEWLCYFEIRKECIVTSNSANGGSERYDIKRKKEVFARDERSRRASGNDLPIGRGLDILMKKSLDATHERTRWWSS